jgi:hypothetical protein
LPEILPPSIWASALRAKGLLQGRQVVVPWVGGSAPKGLSAVRATLEPNSRIAKLSFEVWGVTCEFSAEVCERKNGRVRSLFFICPINLSDVRCLYLLDGKLLSRSALGIRYESQDSPKRRRFYSPRPERRPPLEASGVNSIWDTMHGLETARRNQPAAFRSVESGFDDKVDLMRRAQKPALPLPSGTAFLELEGQPTLDARMLAEAGCLRPGELTPIAFEWPARGPVQKMRGYVDLRHPSFGWLAVGWVGSEGEGGQIINLVRHSKRSRPRFVCPVRWRDTNLVGFREGRFASPAAQRLRRGQFDDEPEL